MYYRIVNAQTRGQLNLVMTADNEKVRDNRETRDRKRYDEAFAKREQWLNSHFRGAHLVIEPVAEYDDE